MREYAAVETSMSDRAAAQGSEFSIRTDARRIFAAATISMVRVICFVDVTELMRLSMS